MGSTNETLALSYALALHSGVRPAPATCRQGRRKAPGNRWLQSPAAPAPTPGRYAVLTPQDVQTGWRFSRKASMPSQASASIMLRAMTSAAYV